MSWLDAYFFGIKQIASAGVTLTQRPVVNFIGATVADNPSLNRTDVTVSGGGAAITWAGDLAGSSNTTQQVVSVTGAAGVLAMAATAAVLTWAAATSGPTLKQASPTSDAATQTLTVQAQSAWSGATTNIAGAPLHLQGGAPKTAGSAGTRGGVRLQLGGDTTQTLAEVAEVAVGRRVVALCQVSTGVTSTQLPANSGDGVIYIANANVNPAASPVGGAILFSSGGVLNVYQSNGTTFAIGSQTWGADLAGSSSTQQWVASISGSGGAGGSVPLNVTTLAFATGQSSPTLKQADNVTNGATAQPLTIQAQNATGTTATGGALVLKSGTGTSAAGAVQLYAGATQVGQLGAGSGDFVSLGAAPALTGRIRITNGDAIMVRYSATDREVIGYSAGVLSVGDTSYPFTQIYSSTSLQFLFNTGLQPAVSAVDNNSASATAWVGHPYHDSVLCVANPTADAATGAARVEGGNAWATATLTNRVGGDVKLVGGAASNGSGQNPGTIRMLSAQTGGSSTFDFLDFFCFGSGQTVTITASASASGVNISQAASTGAGANFTIQAQNAGGTNQAGGYLDLRAGSPTGTGTVTGVRMWSDGVQIAQAIYNGHPTFIVGSNTTSLPSSVMGFAAYDGSAKKIALVSGTSNCLFGYDSTANFAILSTVTGFNFDGVATFISYGSSNNVQVQSATTGGAIPSDISAQFGVVNGTNTTVVVKIRGAASQSANLLNLEDNSGNALFTVSGTGASHTWGAAVSSPTLTQSQSTTGAGVNLTIQAQAAKAASAAAGGQLILYGGTHDGAGAAGGVLIAADASASMPFISVQSAQVQIGGGSNTTTYIDTTTLHFRTASATEYATLASASFSWAQATSAPQFTQATQAAGSNPNNLTIAPQGPNASAVTTATGTPGSLIVALAAPVSTGAEAFFTVSRTGIGNVFQVGHGGFAGSFMAMWLGPITATVSNYAFLGDGSTFTILNVASGGNVSLRAANATYLTMTSGAVTVFNGDTVITGGGTGIFGIGNCSAAPTSNPTGGVAVYAQSGALKCRGTSGTITTMAAADLEGFHGHCPECGTDFAVEWKNDKYGLLTVCVHCLADELGPRRWIARKAA